jgi:hypothetical protein
MKGLHRSLALCLAGVLTLGGAWAGEKKKDAEPTKAEKLEKAYKKAIKDSTSYKGFFHLRQKEGALYADLAGGDLGKPFLVLAQIARGISQGDLLGGTMWSMSDEWVLEFRKVDEKIQLVRKNIRFTAKKGSPLDEAVKLSFSDSVIASLDIVGATPTGQTLVKLDGIFLSDLLSIGSALKDALGSGYSLSRKLSTWNQIKAFPKNLELEANLTYKGGEYADLETIPDSRFVTLTVHYSVVAMPGDKYKPRKADDRVGHFLTALKDYSNEGVEGPFVRYVNRWFLEKANPKAKRSTVKRPIVFYLERSIPYEYRPSIRAGILEWNKAFAKVGLLDAIEVRLQSEDDDWDPEDVRYNTIRWISSPYTFAIGPTHVNPLTGQILDADVLIDASWIGSWQREIQFWNLSQDARTAWGLNTKGAAPPQSRLRRGNTSHRAFLEGFAHQFSLGALALAGKESKGDGDKGDEAKKEEDKHESGLPMWYIGEALKDLVMHEVGHTLGLRHNFKASALRDMKGLHDKALTRKEGLVGSVMDYLPINLAPEGKTQGELHPTTLGPYDYWGIEYAYKDAASEKDLKKIASRCAEPALAYASDEDRSTQNDRNLDPLVATWDIGKDPLVFAESQLEHVKKLWDKIIDRVVEKGKNYTRARKAVGGLLWEIYNGAQIAARFVGGQYHHRDHKGDPGERPAFVPVDAATQRRALKFLGEGLFSDASYKLSPELLNRLAPSHWWHWGSDIFGKRLDFPFHEKVARIQRRVLLRLLNPAVLERIMDAEKKVPAKEDFLTVPELVKTLTNMIFQELTVAVGEKKWTSRKPYISSLRRNLQRNHVSVLSQLVLLVSATKATDAGLVARAQLQDLRQRILKVSAAGAGKLDVYSQGHLEDLGERIRQVLEAKRQVSTF